MDRTLVIELNSQVTFLTFKFAMGYFNGLLVEAKVQDSLYKIYYFSPAL